MDARTGRLRVSRRILCGSLLVAGLTYACSGGSDSTGPGGARGIRVVAGGGQTDIVNKQLLQALVVEVRDSTGRIAPGITVRFHSVVDVPGPYVLVSPIEQRQYTYDASDVTDARGQAMTMVQLGTAAGTARVAVTVPELALVDTVSYTATNGPLARFTISPRDTAITPGKSYALEAVPADLYGNPIPGATPTFAATGVTVSATGQVAATGTLGRTYVVVSYQGVKDSARVTVDPLFSMVINKGGSVVLVNSDGTGATTLATTTDNSISPSAVPATPNVVYYKGNPGGDARVWVVQPNGTPRALVSGDTISESWPRLSPDGAWVYFMRGWGELVRVRLDGSGLESLMTYTPNQPYAAPTVSPDGRSVAVEDRNGVKIVDVATKVSRTVPVACGYPSYSPNGAWFACASATDISVMKLDGTGRRVIYGGGQNYLSGVDWTPDGKWILALTGYANLYDVATGAVLPLSGLNNGFMQASFVR
jgi:Tol biopolymer transport system component